MFGLDDHKDDHKNDEDKTGGLPFTPPAKPDPDPKPDGVLDDSLPIMPQPKAPTFIGPSKPAGPPPASDEGEDDTDELLDIKRDALQQLSPLVSHLNQTPEEKFRTTMMMIQAADNHKLIKIAYEAAQQIKDDKTRAQALLDVINEINYFTHRPEPENE
ncbi:hypothetical protein HY218_01740 [Candidatus Saccharibacteria bacterium]|nr:hypothetical protein [Candidatus Saccharibacteria bacterium]